MTPPLARTVLATPGLTPDDVQVYGGTAEEAVAYILQRARSSGWR